jgi:pyruvate-formate lyase-activating enzyme
VDSATDGSFGEAGLHRSGFLPDRIIHLHPTRLCNLACLHCYSESDPHHRAALDTDLLIASLPLLRAEGYAAISLSGGEPLVYPALDRVVAEAQALGFRVTMVSNGLLANERMDPLLDRLDGMAISFDGLAPTHNRLRGRHDAFPRASAALKRLADRGRSVGAAISLERDSIPELPDLADHLVDHGARALQVRPVARAGRARTLPGGTFLTAADRARLYLVTLALEQELPDVRIHCDLAPAQGLWRERAAYASLLADCATGEERPLADLVNPLVIDESGMLKPIAYDFDPGFDVMPLDLLTPSRLADYKRQRLPRLRDVVGAALAGLEARHDLVDWFDHCARLSEATAEPQDALAGSSKEVA